MKRILISIAAASCIVAPATGQYVDSGGYWGMWDGTMVLSDTNPMMGQNFEFPGFPTGVDLDPDYDWCILETMVSEPLHPMPFYLWPGGRQMMEEGFGSHEMGFSMGYLIIRDDPNGADISDWGTGDLRLMGMFGMNHQHNGGHSGVSYWVDFGTMTAMPWKMVGTITEPEFGDWIDTYGPGWVMKAEGDITHMLLTPEFESWGRITSFQVSPLTDHLGDMDLDTFITMHDIDIFAEVLLNMHHDDMSKFLLADINEDGVVDLWDLLLLLEMM